MTWRSPTTPPAPGVPVLVKRENSPMEYRYAVARWVPQSQYTVGGWESGQTYLFGVTAWREIEED